VQTFSQVAQNFARDGKEQKNKRTKNLGGRGFLLSQKEQKGKRAKGQNRDCGGAPKPRAYFRRTKPKTAKKLPLKYAEQSRCHRLRRGNPKFRQGRARGAKQRSSEKAARKSVRLEIRRSGRVDGF
jgi:hypothetical protein